MLPIASQYKLPELILDLETCRKEFVQNLGEKNDLSTSPGHEQEQKGLAKVAGMRELKELLIDEVVGLIKNKIFMFWNDHTPPD